MRHTASHTHKGMCGDPLHLKNWGQYTHRHTYTHIPLSPSQIPKLFQPLHTHAKPLKPLLTHSKHSEIAAFRHTANTTLRCLPSQRGGLQNPTTPTRRQPGGFSGSFSTFWARFLTSKRIALASASSKACCIAVWSPVRVCSRLQAPARRNRAESSLNASCKHTFASKIFSRWVSALLT